MRPGTLDFPAKRGKHTPGVVSFFGIARPRCVHTYIHYKHRFGNKQAARGEPGAAASQTLAYFRTQRARTVTEGRWNRRDTYRAPSTRFVVMSRCKGGCFVCASNTALRSGCGRVCVRGRRTAGARTCNSYGAGGDACEHRKPSVRSVDAQTFMKSQSRNSVARLRGHARRGPFCARIPESVETTTGRQAVQGKEPVNADEGPEKCPEIQGMTLQASVGVFKRTAGARLLMAAAATPGNRRRARAGRARAAGRASPGSQGTTRCCARGARRGKCTRRGPCS